MNSTSESTTSTTSHSAAAIAASLTTCCWIQPRTGGNGRLRLTVMLLNGTRTNVGGRRSASQRICVRGPASRPNSLRSDRGTMMWCQTVSGELSSTDRFNATHNSKSGAKLFVITAMRVMALLLTISCLILSETLTHATRATTARAKSIETQKLVAWHQTAELPR